MTYGRTQSMMNFVIDKTANAMGQSMYQASLANMSLQGVNRGYNTVQNTQYARGLSKGIICGKSACGSEENPTDEYCKKI